MNKATMFCPLCNAKLRPIGGFWDCPNDHREWVGTKDLWAEYIKTKQKLDIAMDALKGIAFGDGVPPDENDAYNFINKAAETMDKIRTLDNQKD